MLGAVAMLIIPIPVVMLDFFQILSIVAAMIILIAVISTRSPLDFAVFPTVLLFTTIFRLAINVSSTRLILTEGESFQGKVITAFANFVIQGNYVVGAIIFIVITAVMFMVITKGATRVSEVSARFQLDAMPQKQLAIDTELSQGIINEEQAIEKREQIQEEAAFYGNMDGASKFVSGDIKVGILITVVNIVGGLITGMIIRSESFQTALTSYVMLSIGDGLVAQIPSLLVSTAAGIIVTKSTSRQTLGEDVRKQLFSDAKALYIVAGFVLFLSFLPGFPMVALWLTSAFFFYLGYQITRVKKEEKIKGEIETEKEQVEEEPTSPEKMVDLVQVDPLEVELGYSLIPLVDRSAGGDLLDRIKKSRRQIAMEYGLIVPQVRITDNMQLQPEEYVVKLKGDAISGGRLRINHLLALNTEGSEAAIEGEKTVEPVFQLPAYWIDESRRKEAEKKGYTVFDGPTIVATHLTETIKSHAGDIMGRREVKMILDAVKKRNPVIVEELGKNNVKLGDIQKILQELLREKLSIRNIDAILEWVCDHAGGAMGKEELVETIRSQLNRQISSKYADSAKNIHVMTFSPQIERELMDIAAGSEPYSLSLSPEALERLLSTMRENIQEVQKKGYSPVLVTDRSLRRPIRAMMEKAYPHLAVIAYTEIADGYRLDVVGTV